MGVHFKSEAKPAAATPHRLLLDAEKFAQICITARCSKTDGANID